MRYLSLCAIAKEETPYLVEWVAYHLAVGVEHFYIYDNESSVPVKETLKPYIDKGLVTVIDFPGRGQQMPSYTHCIQTYGKESQWIGVVDCDEYIVPKASDTISPILEKYEQFGGLAVSWIIFGSSGHLIKPEGLVIENYTAHTPADWGENTHIKSIIRPSQTVRAGANPHSFIYTRENCCVSENYQAVHNAWTPNSTKKIQLNHYITKSLEEFKIKLQRGRADIADPNAVGRTIENFDHYNKNCTQTDDYILRFVEKTKENILI
jgi:hypothetical protein